MRGIVGIRQYSARLLAAGTETLGKRKINERGSARPVLQASLEVVLSE